MHCYLGHARSLRRLGVLAASALTLATTMAIAAKPHRHALEPDGDTLVRNKQLLADFYRDVFGKMDVEAASRYLREDYIQHNPHVPTGLKGFQTFFRERFAQASREMKASFKLEVLHVVAEGDLVVMHTHQSGIGPDGKPFDVTGFDLFRVQDAMIAEHWDASAPK
jgi:predicted SnoaL-like aldol condensation-catalyzing enzyme